jgi:O-antigen/teichoic acid export membrane protein
MSRSKDLAKNTFILALGNFLPHFASLVTLPIYTGMLTKTELGSYDLVVVTVYIVTVIFTLQIHHAVFRFLIDVRGKEDEKSYITNTVIFVLIPSIIASTIFGMTFQELSSFSQILIAFYTFLNIQYAVFGQIARGLGKNKVYSIGAIINTVLNLIMALILMVGRGMGFNGLFISLNLAFLAGTVYQIYVCRIPQKMDLQLLNKSTLKELLSYSWPIVPNALSLWMVNSFAKWVIRFFLGLEMNAVFAVAGKIPNIFGLAYSTFNMAWQESASIAVSDEDKDAYYSKIFNAFLFFITGVVLLLIAATPLLFKILIKGSYAEAYNHIPILFISVFFSSIASFFGSMYIAHKRTKSVGISSTIAALTSCGLNLVLIKPLGLYAASSSMVFSFMVLAVYRGVDLHRKKIVILKIDPIITSLCFLLILISAILCYKQSFWMNIINLVLAVISSVILNRNLLRSGKDYLSNLRGNGIGSGE